MAKKTIKYLENGEYHDATVKDVGVIEELKTESKDNLVEAINEIFLGGGKGFSDLQQKVDESTQAAQNAQQAADNLQQKLDEVAQNVGLSEEEAQKIINQAVEDAKKAQAEALQAYKDAQKELDDSMAQFMEDQKAINKELEQAKTDIQGDIDQKNTEIEQINAVIESTKSDLTATSAQLASVRNDLTNAQMDWGKVRTEITNINGKLDSKMSNTDFDEYKERIEHNETEITQTKNELQSKATKQDLDVLTGTVTTQGSNITQLAGKIEEKVSKDTLANNIDDFQVKKANIFTGTREFMGWEFSDKALGRVNDDSYNHAKVAEINSGAYLYITIDGLEVGKTYSVSIFAKVSKATNGGVTLVADDGKAFNGVMKGIYAPHDTKVITDWQRYYATIVASATKMKFTFQRNNIVSDTVLYLNRPKLEVGETVYAWEDNAQDIYKRVEHTEAQFDVYNDQISGIVKRQTETDKKIENVSSTFTQRADGIEANAKKYTNDKVTGLTEEFSGRLRATSQELSTEYEKQTNAKIGALSDGGSNLILNSSFLVTDNNGNATLENWRDTSSKISLTKPNGLDGTWIRVNRATTGTALGARTNYFPVKQGKLVVGVDVALDGTGNISPYVLRIEYYDVSNNRVNYEDITLQKLGLSASQITKSGSNFRYARGVYKTSNDRNDVAKACIVVPETITGYDMYLTNFFAKFSDVNDGTYEVNPLDQQASLIKQRTKIEQDSEKINLLNTQTEKLGNDIKATNTSVNVLKGEVDLKASQSTVNDLTNRVAKNEADIKVFPDKIKSEVSEVSKKIDGVNDKVDGIQVGGTNLMRNTTRDYVKFTGNGSWGVDYLTPNHQAVDTPVEGGETYTFSAWVKNDSSSAGRIDLEIYQLNANGENKSNGSSSDVSVWVSPGEEKRLVFTKTLLADTTSVRLHTRNKDRNGIVTYWAKMAQVEKGTIATDWSPAPEDTDASIESVKTVATQTKDGFDRLTEKTGYNANTGEFSKVTTQINEGIKGVSTQVASVSNRLDNLSVGGTNLLKGTSRDLQQKSTTNDWVRLPYTTDFFRSIYPLDNFTARVWIENPNKDSWLQIYVGGNGLFKGNVIKAGQSGYSEVHGTLNKEITGANLVIGAGDGVSVSLSWKELKLEKGNMPTDWSPAPEDLQEGINTATTKTTQTDTKFERMISQIQYNDSTGEIGKYEHKITELANGTQEKISALTKRGNNMVIKSSFDDGTDLGGWYVASVYGSDFYRTTTTPKPDEMSSNYCLASGTRDALEANNIFPVTSGTKYYISAWVYTSQKYSGKVGLYVKNSNNNNVTHLGVTVPKDNQNRWIKIKGTITIPNGYNIAQPWLQVEKMVSDNEKIYFADISITRADDNAIELSETMTTRIGDLERTVRTNTTDIGQYRQEMTNSAKEWSTKFTSITNGIGGTNLLRNTRFSDGSNWGYTGTAHMGTQNTNKPSGVPNDNQTMDIMSTTANSQNALTQTPKVKAGETYIVSFWAKADEETYMQVESNQNTRFNQKIGTSWQKYSGQVMFQSDNRTLYIYPTTANVWVHINSLKLEKGTIATDWSPSPEDFDNKIGDLQGQITANANKFNTVYTKTDVDNKISPLNSRTEFLQDNSKFLLRVQEAGAATGGVNNLLTNSDTFDGYSENNTNSFDFQKIEGSGLPSVPNQPSITKMGHVWNDYGSAYNKNDGIYLENGETYWFGVYLMTDSNAGAFRNLSVYASLDKGQTSGSANKYFAGEAIDFNRTFKGKTKTWVWNTYKFTGDGTTRYNWRIEPYNHIGGSIWTAGYMLVKSPLPPTGWSPNMTDVQMRLDSGGLTINGNTRINGTLNAKGMVLDDKTGSKLEFTPNGLDISYSQNRNQYFTFSGGGLDFWKYTEAEGIEDFPYHHKPGYARLGNLTAWDGSYNDRTNYTARKHLDHPTNYNGMGFVIDVTGGSDEFSIWQEGTSYRSSSGAVGAGEYWSLFNVNATGFGAGRGRGIHHYTSNYFWSDQENYNWQDDATLLGTIHDNGWKELEIMSYRSTMAVKSEPHNSNAWVNGFIFGSKDGGERLFGYDGNQWIDVVNKRTTRDGEDYKNHFASMHLWEVQAHAFTTTSQLSQKIDIEPLDTKDFMSKLLSIDLCKYRYKTQSSEEKDNYGAIIDDVNEVKKYNLPQEFITTRDKGVNTNNLITGLIATAQEQAKQIEDLTFRILEIERRNING
ncbi:carbohydrate binding domain-containing protein [Ligilactobacillus salivarius]|uniref:Phage-associated protein, putative specificity/tail protein n=1 Tax=Ligilactobacillus salivarius TaxID=1624 RepID=A0A089RZ94_9LACO|nr:carbohydrate binding domain-containing protein [Ligilactobacillus salivarius]AIR11752.1 Phage-associated protein, putative specificity/tail protein [Ligilactobacillus salivarius]